MQTSIICLLINLVAAAVFSLPTVAFLNEYPIVGGMDTTIVETVEDPRAGVSEPLEAMEASVEADVLEALVEPVEAVTEVVEPIVEVPEVVVEPEFEHLKPSGYFGYFDVPLDHELQDHIFALCEEAGIDPALVLAIIQKESMFDAGAIGDQGRARGLMQVQERWHFDRIEELGVTDLLDPYQNVSVGISYIEELFHICNDTEWVLMAYNGGPVYANRKVEAGVVTEYVDIVMETMEGLR